MNLCNRVLTTRFLPQNEKLTKREVEAKFCNFSLSTNSVSVCQPFLHGPPAKTISPAAANLFALVNIKIPPLLIPVADIVQVHRTEGGSAGAGAAADITHQAEDSRHSAGQAGPQRPGGAHPAAAQTGGQTAGD